MTMPFLGPISKAMFESAGDDPPAIIREWLSNLESQDNYVFFWAAAKKGLSWSNLHTHLGDSDWELNPVVCVPPANVERLLSPLSHEGRIKIMQALFDRSVAASELSACTGFQGGGLYHHLRELKYAGYISDKDGEYRLTQIGQQLLITVALITQVAIVDKGEHGLAVGANWDQAVSQATKEQSSGPLDSTPWAKLVPLEHTVEEMNVGSPEAAPLRIEVTEVRGSAPALAPGERYVVRGRYTQKGQRVAWLRLAAVGTARGEQARIRYRAGDFTTAAEILEVKKGREHVLDVMMADRHGRDLGIRARITLASPLARVEGEGQVSPRG